MRNLRRVGTVVATAAWLLCGQGAVANAAPSKGARVATEARKQIGVTTGYDPAYRSLKYPGGDVALKTGVCTDVVVRALRGVGLDLQKAVHEDMRRNFSTYPQRWNLKKPDRNIDHRRVPNLMRYFERHHTRLKNSTNAADYLVGDIVTWDLGRGILHIGIVSSGKKGSTPLIIHNIGSGAKEQDVLFQYKIIGHYRMKAAAPKPIKKR